MNPIETTSKEQLLAMVLFLAAIDFQIDGQRYAKSVVRELEGVDPAKFVAELRKLALNYAAE